MDVGSVQEPPLEAEQNLLNGITRGKGGRAYPPYPSPGCPARAPPPGLTWDRDIPRPWSPRVLPCLGVARAVKASPKCI